MRRDKARRFPHLATVTLAALATAAACTDIPVKNELPPSGNIKGVVQYTGPLPCTASGHVLGSALLLLFGTDLLPPPDGLGTNARSLAVVPGDVLFQSVQSSLPMNADGSVACPPANAPHVTVSADWIVGPLQKGTYQVRSFYDYDGDFSPILKIHNLPTKGDIGGGALANPLEAAVGAKPVFREIVIDPGTNGVEVEGVAVTIGQLLTESRPISFVESVIDERPVPGVTLNTDAKAILMPVDQRFSKSPTLAANLATADKEFIRVILRSGTQPDEWNVSVQPPLSLQAAPPYNTFKLSQNRDAAGKIIAIPEKTSPALVDLFPEVIFARLDPSDKTNLTPYADPAVIMQGLVTPVSGVKGLLTLSSASAKPVVADEVQAALRPAAFCARPLDPTAPLVLVTPSLSTVPDAQGKTEAVLSDLIDLKSKLAARFHRDPSDVLVVIGCVPPGSYAINLVYDTGQAWTIPNESGVCQPPLETSAAGGTQCQQLGVSNRPVLASQNTMIRVGGRQDAAYCDGVAAANDAQAANSDPAQRTDTVDKHGNHITYVAGIPTLCLTTAEANDEASLRRRMDGGL